MRARASWAQGGGARWPGGPSCCTTRTRARRHTWSRRPTEDSARVVSRHSAATQRLSARKKPAVKLPLIEAHLRPVVNSRVNLLVHLLRRRRAHTLVLAAVHACKLRRAGRGSGLDKTKRGKPMESDRRRRNCTHLDILAFLLDGGRDAVVDVRERFAVLRTRVRQGAGSVGAKSGRFGYGDEQGVSLCRSAGRTRPS